MPNSPAIRPFIIDRPDRPAMNTIEKARMPVSSTGPIPSAYSASSWATRISTMVEKRSPMTDANNPILRAFCALPARASGYPAIAVGVEDGSPGVFSRIAETALPAVEPFAMPTRKAMAASGER